MFNLDEWMDTLVSKIKKEFAERVVFIGLQGSYGRNEAREDSDIDVVVILDRLAIGDLKQYRGIIAQMPFKEKACGFISGADEIKNWEKSELFQFCHDTKPICGEMDHLLCHVGNEDIIRAIKIGAGSLYHACCHNFIYEQSPEILQTLYKPAFFILQAKYYIETGRYIRSKAELLSLLDGTDREILNKVLERNFPQPLTDDAFQAYHEKLLAWCSELLIKEN